jgi:hypothetical protein
MQQPDEKVTVSQAPPSTEQAAGMPEMPPCDWNAIDWKSAVEYVRKLRQAIFRATKEGDLESQGNDVDLVNCLSRVR